MNQKEANENQSLLQALLGELYLEEILLDEKPFELPFIAPYAFVIVLSGTLDLHTDGQHLSLPSGCYAVLHASRPSQLKGAKNKPVTILLINFKQAYFHKACQSPELQPLWRVIEPQKPHYYSSAYFLRGNNLGNSLSHLLKWRYQERTELASLKEISGDLLIKELLLGELYLSNQIQSLPIKNDAVARSMFYNLLKAKLYIIAHFQESLNIFKMARVANVSEAHFSRNFKTLFKLSPIQYQIQIRIDEAAMIIRRTTQSISQVAEEVGFDNIASFSRSFKKLYGLSPREYRRYNDLHQNFKKD